MKAKVEGTVVGKVMTPPKDEKGFPKFQIGVHQEGDLENTIVTVSDDQYNKIEIGKVLSLPVTITAWKTDRSYGLNCKAVS